MEKKNKKQLNQQELLESVIKNPIINENGEIVVTDPTIFGDYASQEEVEAALQKYIK